MIKLIQQEVIIMTNKFLIGVILILVGFALTMIFNYPQIGFYIMGVGSTTIVWDLWK